MFKKTFFKLAIIFSFTFLFSGFASATNEVCTEYGGSNKNMQDYTDFSSPITSYLTTTDDGGLMRFQYIGSGKEMLVQYFTADYTLKNSILIPAELPIFGGFCENANFYFILTGQENPDESSTKEVFRITKYDKSWNKYDYTSIKKTDTATPFFNSPARFAQSGDYLLIRTNHKIYPSLYGNDYNANITLQLDTEGMIVTSQLTGLQNIDFGKMCNSFNQFIELDESDVTVALDHIVSDTEKTVKITNYNKSMSDGEFYSSYMSLCTCVDMFPETQSGNNSVSSVGGFEISDTKYIIVGVSNNNNIFISSVDHERFSSLSVPEITYVTDYTDSGNKVSTPYLVKISSERFILLWSYCENVYYTELDKNGKVVGNTYMIKGDLSDCAPIVSDGKIIWYTWDNAEIIFYEINTNDLAESKTVIPKIHSFNNYKSDGNATCTSDGTKTAKCDNCDKTNTLTDTGSVKGHKMGSWVQINAATCTSDGADRRDCANCDYYETSTVLKLNHNFADSFTTDKTATCRQEGSKSRHCTRNGCTAKASITAIAKLDHIYTSKVTQTATCTKAGIKKYTCSCGDSHTQAIAKKAHSLTALKAVAATCTKAGKTAGKKCSVCGTVTVAQTSVPKKSHALKTTTTKATLSKNGKAVTKCTVCGTTTKSTSISMPKTIKLSTTSYTYNGKARTPSVTVKDSAGKTLKKNTDYTVKYESGRKNIGKYTVTISFKGNYSGTKKLTFTVVPKVTGKITATQTATEIALNWSKVAGATGYRIYQYNSKTKKYEKIKTTTSRSYTIKNLKAGTTYKFKVKAYTKVDSTTFWGSASDEFTTSTKPAKTTLSKVAAGSKKATVTWKAVAGATGYQVLYSTSKDFDNAKKVTVKKSSSKKITIKKLTKGKKYYFKVRSYKTVGGKNIYGSYSSVKNVKVK